MIEQGQNPLRIDVALMCESIWESAGFCYGGSPIFYIASRASTVKKPDGTRGAKRLTFAAFFLYNRDDINSREREDYSESVCSQRGRRLLKAACKEPEERAPVCLRPGQCPRQSAVTGRNEGNFSRSRVEPRRMRLYKVTCRDRGRALFCCRHLRTRHTSRPARI